MPRPSLTSKRATGGQGVVDVTGPSGTGGKGSGRKTILNYGSGSGGRGGGLSGRGRLAEPEPTASIVKKAAPAAEPKQAVTEVAVDGKGVGMTISGQISGRKILKGVTPQYTARARQKGWEGVVAVHFTVLADGRVLVLGEPENEEQRVPAELWDPDTATFSIAGMPVQRRAFPTATPLLDGRVLIVGGGGSPAAAQARIAASVSDTGARGGRLARVDSPPLRQSQLPLRFREGTSDVVVDLHG